jgi:hypothetical protein
MGPCSPPLLIAEHIIPYTLPGQPAYPSPGVTTIPGSGAFCTWGVNVSGITMTGVLFVNSSGVAYDPQPTVTSVNLGTSNWGYAVYNWAGMSGFYMVYTYKQNGIDHQSTKYGPYST